MSKNMNKKIEDQDKLLDHIIEYGGKQYIDDEIEEFDQIPELELSDEFNQRMDKMFKNAYKKEARKERMHLARRVAAIAIVVLGIVSVTAMNVKAFREPVLNFIFKMNGSDTTEIKTGNNIKTKENYSFSYIPKGYTCIKKHYLDNKSQIIYTYKNKENKFFYIKVQFNETQTSYAKISKNGNYEELFQNNHHFYFLENKNNTLLMYKNNCIFRIIGSLEKNELIRIASAIKIKK